MNISFRKLSHALGAEVRGVDITQPMSEVEFGEIYRAFLDNGILLLRDQNCRREDHIEFSRRFGELDKHDSLPRDRHPDHPELLLVSNALREKYGPDFPVDLVCPYLPYARQDRVCYPGEAFSLKLACGLINAQGYRSVTLFDVHSKVAMGLLAPKVAGL